MKRQKKRMWISIWGVKITRQNLHRRCDPLHEIPGSVTGHPHSEKETHAHVFLYA